MPARHRGDSLTGQSPSGSHQLLYHPTAAGTSLTELRGLAIGAGLDWGMAHRSSREAEFVIPSVLHLRSGHYTALIRTDGDRYLLRDPILGGDP